MHLFRVLLLSNLGLKHQNGAFHLVPLLSGGSELDISSLLQVGYLVLFIPQHPVFFDRFLLHVLHKLLQLLKLCLRWAFVLSDLCSRRARYLVEL